MRLIKIAAVICISGMVASVATIMTATGRKEFGDYYRGHSTPHPVSMKQCVGMTTLYVILWPVTTPFAIAEIHRRKQQQRVR